MNLPKVNINKHEAVDLGKRVKDKVSEDDISGAAAEMAYRFFLALFPFFIFLAALGGFIASALNVDNPTDEIMSLIGDSLPEDSASVLRTQLEGVVNQQNVGLLSLGAVAAIWTSSAAFNALMKNLNKVYDVEEDRGLVARYAISLGLTLLSAGLIVIAFVIFFFGQIYGPDIAEEIGFGSEGAWFFTFVRWPAAIIIVMAAMAFLYWLAPNTGIKLAWISPGAVFFAAGWVIASYLFGLYVSNFGSYNATYGALGAVVILLIWFYITAFLILLGAEINALIAERQPEKRRERRAGERWVRQPMGR